MNTKDFLIRLAEQLKKTSVHPECLQEILDILDGAGCKKQFLSVFTNRLDFLQEHGRNAVQIEGHKFERIDKEICSMHVDTTEKNIRILYSITRDGSILLLAFDEKEGKRNTDYTTKTPEAARRLHELED